MSRRMTRGLSKDAPDTGPSLLVRNLRRETIERLKQRAAANGRSVEAEHRSILEDAPRPAATGAELWERLEPSEPVELDIERLGDRSVKLPNLG